MMVCCVLIRATVTYELAQGSVGLIYTYIWLETVPCVSRNLRKHHCCYV